jgi:hypothetical protein
VCVCVSSDRLTLPPSTRAGAGEPRSKTSRYGDNASNSVDRYASVRCGAERRTEGLRGAVVGGVTLEAGRRVAGGGVRSLNVNDWCVCVVECGDSRQTCPRISGWPGAWLSFHNVPPSDEQRGRQCERLGPHEITTVELSLHHIPLRFCHQAQCSIRIWVRVVTMPRLYKCNDRVCVRIVLSGRRVQLSSPCTRYTQGLATLSDGA